MSSVGVLNKNVEKVDQVFIILDRNSLINTMIS